jgi:hypothetical protein
MPVVTPTAFVEMHHVEVTPATAPMIITHPMLTFQMDACANKVLIASFSLKHENITNISFQSSCSYSLPIYYGVDYNPKSNEHCRRSCGNLTIPFPFGLEEDCYGNERFQLNCTASNTTLFSSGKARAECVSRRWDSDCQQQTK